MFFLAHRNRIKYKRQIQTHSLHVNIHFPVNMHKPQFCEPFIGHAGSEQCFQPSYGRELTYSGTCGSTHWKNYKHFQHTFYVGKQGCLCCLKSFQSWCAQGIVFWVKVVPPVFYFLLQSVGAGRSSRYHSTSSSSLSSVSLLELLVPGMLLASQANYFKE